MFKFSVIFNFLVLLLRSACSEENNNKTYYEVPCNIQYPFGDEVQFNVNLLDNNTNPFPCEEFVGLDSRLGKCPIELTNDTSLLNPYIECPGYAIIPPPQELVYVSSQKPNPELQCKKCDLKLTSDSSAILVDCSNCFDVPSPHRPANKTEKNAVYKVFFIEISNYSTVDVTGTEFFNPV